MAKRIFILGLLAICVSGLQAEKSVSKNTNPDQMTLPEAIKAVQPSVVQITGFIDQPHQGSGPFQIPHLPLQIPLGTGFMVNADGYVITARHVVEALQSMPGLAANKHLSVGVAMPTLDKYKMQGGGTISMRASFGFTDCDIIDEDEQHDIALLKMKRNPFKQELGVAISSGPSGSSMDYLHGVAILSPSRPRDGERIAVSGYPLNIMVLVTTSGNVASAWASRTVLTHPPGLPGNLVMPDYIDSYLADMHVNHGNSGGPVYSVEDGAVIGLCVSFEVAPVEHSNGNVDPSTRGLFVNSGLADIVPAGFVIDLLRKHNLTWTEKTAKNQVKPASRKP